MLTRIEVDGFKNLVGFAADFAPFTCIAGPNGVGKSNLFDAIRFLSLLADHTLDEAALRVRDSSTEYADQRHLFCHDGAQAPKQFRIAAEMLVSPRVQDDFGRPAEASSTYLRYEVQIGYEPPSFPGSLGRLVLRTETLRYITEGAAARRLRFPHRVKQFRDHVVVNRRHSQSGYISVRTASDSRTEIVVHADGGSRGSGQVAPAETAPRTIVCTATTTGTPTILAARREMQHWHLLALEPTAMRRPDRFQADPHVTARGAHLPATLFRLAQAARKRGEDPETVFARITARLARLVPIAKLNVQVDEARQLLTLQVAESSGIQLPAASLSDGTLRFLALAVLAEDSQAQGVICLEEPENGIHPAKMRDMVQLLAELAVDPSVPPGDENPFRQVIVATHSPAFVQLQKPDDLLCAIDARVRGQNGKALRTLRCRPLDGTWRATAGDEAVGKGTILAYLTAPPGAQLTLDLNGIDPNGADALGTAPHAPEAQLAPIDLESL